MTEDLPSPDYRELGFQELVDEFLLEAHERADRVESLLLELVGNKPEDRQQPLTRVKRELHTLKGNSGMMGYAELQQLAHGMEDQIEQIDLKTPHIDDLLADLDRMRQQLSDIRQTALHSAVDLPGIAASPDVGSSESEDIGGVGGVRVAFAHIDQLAETQAEALIFRNRLGDTIAACAAAIAAVDSNRQDNELIETLKLRFEAVERSRQTLEKTLNQLQRQITELGLVPLQPLFRSLARIVHDESQREGKEIELDTRGGDTPIDKALLEVSADALGHLVRNAVIHGIELPEIRAGRDKPATGTVRVAATLDANEVRIEVSDDGAGIDVNQLRATAERDAPEVAAASSLALLFHDGLSTHDGTDLAAGRGVGLAAVKRSVEQHGGRITVRSTRQAGSTFIVHLPLTASISRCLLIEVDGEGYALPLPAVAEVVTLANDNIHEVNHSQVVRWRKEWVPLLDLGQAFGTAVAIRDTGSIIILDLNGRQRGLVIDQLAGIRDIVVKGLDSIVGRPIGISGSTILGDGRVIMILDPAALLSRAPSTVGHG